MDCKDAILTLRRSLGLSQDAFAERLFVTRQAVSRWETGETVPRTDTLKLIAQTFHVPVDQLLGQAPELCQSCGMVLAREEDRGTERDGSRSAEYCRYCYQDGEFTQPLTLEEQVENNLLALAEWNASAGLDLTEGEARAQLLEFLPTLKRWREG